MVQFNIFVVQLNISYTEMLLKLETYRLTWFFTQMSYTFFKGFPSFNMKITINCI